MRTLEFLHPSSLKQYKSKVITLLETKLWAKVLLGMFLGVLAGFLLSSGGPFGEVLDDHGNQIKTLTSWLAFERSKTLTQW